MIMMNFILDAYNNGGRSRFACRTVSKLGSRTKLKYSMDREREWAVGRGGITSSSSTVLVALAPTATMHCTHSGFSLKQSRAQSSSVF